MALSVLKEKTRWILFWTLRVICLIGGFFSRKYGSPFGQLPWRIQCYHHEVLFRTDGAARKKLIAVALAFYTPEPSKDDLAAFGLSADDYTEEVQTIAVWPDVRPVFSVLCAIATQWRTGMEGVKGLDHNVLPWLMRLEGIEDEATAINDVWVMEKVVLEIILTHK